MNKSDKIIYCINGAAVGDLVAAAPVVKFMIDTYHQDVDYRVAMISDFREIFWFVPKNKIIPLAENYDPTFAVRKLNMDGGKGNVAKLTPSRLKLTHYASIGLSARVLPDKNLKYIELPEVDVSKFGVDFSNAAVFITTYRDITRAWKGDEIKKVAEYVRDCGLTPVFIGKTGNFSIWKTLAVSDFEYPGFGVDLRNQTTLTELATIMKKSKVVFGLDSGPLHLAFTTDTPVIAGFTNVDPALRIPPRNAGCQTVVVQPSLDCRFCQSNTNLDFWNFTKCPKKQEIPDCTLQMTGNIFIEAFKKLKLNEPKTEDIKHLNKDDTTFTKIVK
jgi:hypothetical protein